MDTVAVYWEPKIKTYGIQKKSNLSLFKITFPADRIGAWGVRFLSIAQKCDRFIMTVGHCIDSSTFQISQLVGQTESAQYRKELENVVREDQDMSFSIDAPADAIFFHGPHFGDRYGIAEAAFGILARQKLKILAAGCTGSSIYIVLPDQTAGTAARFLSEAFDVPSPRKKRRDGHVR